MAPLWVRVLYGAKKGLCHWGRACNFFGNYMDHMAPLKGENALFTASWLTNPQFDWTTLWKLIDGGGRYNFFGFFPPIDVYLLLVIWVPYTQLRANEKLCYLVCRLLLYKTKRYAGSQRATRIAQWFRDYNQDPFEYDLLFLLHKDYQIFDNRERFISEHAVQCTSPYAHAVVHLLYSLQLLMLMI